MQQQQQQQQFSNTLASYIDRPQMGLDVEMATDPATGAIFKFQGRKHDDLKQMLDSNKDSLKLEAMKRIISMLARGRDCSDLFPAVVKNVVSKNIEVKKLVYVYLVRYAEEQQDLALLSISTFQRALKDPNQLIRASALRVLSSIRVSMIVPIVMLAIRDAASDMSPYVRKTAAHAIPKLYYLDAEQKVELVTIIEKLLSDRTTLVVGSAVMAFEEVCPEREDLIHRNYRKLCNLLVDVDEWGQVVIINMLTRYARSQFVNPNVDEPSTDEADEANKSNSQQDFYKEEHYSDESDASDNTQQNHNKHMQKRKKHSIPSSPTTTTYYIDLDHRLLLRQTKPLLQSRNASVVMAVAQLYYHVAPRQEVNIIAKALVRLLRSHKEVQSVVLTCIASMSTKRKTIFEPYIKSFFVRTSDPTHIKLLKLEILTNLASSASIPFVLREFQTYITSSDRSFVAAAIQAIGRCASRIKPVTETCLNGLVHLLSNRDEYVIAESVVVIKTLLQTKAAQHYEIICQMAKILDFIKVAAARAAIIWLIGEYNEKVPKLAPDILRKMAKTFIDEEDSVKLQTLNLAVKVYITNPQQTSLLCQYIFTVARYDTNYDIRDRARFLKQFIFPVNGRSKLSEIAKKVFLAPKPAPSLESKYHTRNCYQLGSMSHYLNIRCIGYNDLPDFAKVATDCAARNVDNLAPPKSDMGAVSSCGKGALKKPKILSEEKNIYKTKQNKNISGIENAYSDYSQHSSTTNSEKSDSSIEGDSDSDNQIDAIRANSLNNKSRKHSKTAKIANKRKFALKKKSGNGSPSRSTSSTSSSSTSSSHSSSSSSSSASSSNSSSSSASTNSSSDSESANDNHNNAGDVDSQSGNEFTTTNKNGSQAALAKENQTDVKKEKIYTDLLLLNFDDVLDSCLTPTKPITNQQLNIDLVAPSYTNFNYKELLNKFNSNGLEINYRYTRSPHLYSSSMVSIELQFRNLAKDDIKNIQMTCKALPSEVRIQEFTPIAKLQMDQSTTSILGVDFNDSIHAINFEIACSITKNHLTLKPNVGELVRSVQISLTMFKDECNNLRGMNEHQNNLKLRQNSLKESQPIASILKQKVFECINVAFIGSENNTENAVGIQKKQNLYFVGQTMSSKSLVLITCDVSIPGNENNSILLNLQVNCEKIVIGSIILNELSKYLNDAFNA